MNIICAMTVNELIDEFGGTTATARLFGVLPSAVSNWRKFGSFPGRLHFRILREAEQRGIKITDQIFSVRFSGEAA